MVGEADSVHKNNFPNLFSKFFEKYRKVFNFSGTIEVYKWVAVAPGQRIAFLEEIAS